MLSARELLYHSKRTNKPLPQRGGDKDFCPDHGWLQDKRLEKFFEERKECLSEERVERQGSLVQGEWKPEKQLIELHKEMGKFWSQMGFIDEHRKWLYPEEALYLMETNILEVWYRGLPVSIQQAYSVFLGPELSLEEYQVYSHLRRIGYVIIRHQGKIPFTRYERKIGLDKHIKVKDRKKKRKQAHNSSGDYKKMKTENITPENIGLFTDVSPNVIDTRLEESKSVNPETETSCTYSEQYHNETKSMSIDQHCQNSSVLDYTSNKKHTQWDFSTIEFPDMGSQKTMQLSKPPQRLLPDGVIFNKDVYYFDSGEYVRKCRKRRTRKNVSDDDTCLSELEFSYSEMIQKQYRVLATNWTEYKQKVGSSGESESLISPAEHYWKEDVTPLVKPENAFSTGAILQHLSVIKSLDMSNRPKGTSVELPKVSYDVYMPDAKFKKSHPGVPNHRILVTRSSASPPDLHLVKALEDHFDDDIQNHWAVVDNGEIAFYVFNSMCTPELISMG